jgi:hypothetical protein
MSLDPLVLQAQATAEAGNAVATWLLAKEGASAVTGLTNLAAALPKIPVGGLTPFQLGVISEEIQGINSKATTGGGSADLLNQIGSLISLVSTSEAAASGGAVTATQALLVGVALNVQLGINNALGFFAGSQSVTNPTPSTPA